jgi:hypothetical protein
VLAARLVADSLLSEAGRPGAVLVVQDSATARLLRSADVPIARVERASAIACPGSNDAAGALLPGETGYVVAVAIHPATTLAERTVDATLSCLYVYRGRGQGFGQGQSWLIRRHGAAWRIVRSLGGWIS